MKRLIRPSRFEHDLLMETPLGTTHVSGPPMEDAALGSTCKETNAIAILLLLGGRSRRAGHPEHLGLRAWSAIAGAWHQSIPGGLLERLAKRRQSRRTTASSQLEARSEILERDYRERGP